MTIRLDAEETAKLREKAARLGYMANDGRFVGEGSINKLVCAIAAGEVVMMEPETWDSLRTAARALCDSLRIWHDNGGYECHCQEHKDLEIALGETGRMIGYKP
jgi:hypothetical protein